MIVPHPSPHSSPSAPPPFLSFSPQSCLLAEAGAAATESSTQKTIFCFKTKDKETQPSSPFSSHLPLLPSPPMILSVLLPRCSIRPFTRHRGTPTEHTPDTDLKRWLTTWQPGGGGRCGWWVNVGQVIQRAPQHWWWWWLYPHDFLLYFILYSWWTHLHRDRWSEDTPPSFMPSFASSKLQTHGVRLDFCAGCLVTWRCWWRQLHGRKHLNLM